jgi:RNAse (barnase) inhibitor barstar
MRTIRLDGSDWVDWMDFHDALLQALQPRGGHGASIDAFIDSMIYGGMLKVEPPYEIVVENVTSPDMRRNVEDLSAALARARQERLDNQGVDMEVTLRLGPTLR